MNKRVIMLFATIFGFVGAYIPSLFGDTSLLDGWQLLTSFIGGLFGIWLGIYISKRWG